MEICTCPFSRSNAARGAQVCRCGTRRASAADGQPHQIHVGLLGNQQRERSMRTSSP